MVACDGGQTLRGKLFHTDGTDTEQRQHADYFNVKEFPNPEWVWADCFHGKQFVTRFVCVMVTHAASPITCTSPNPTGWSRWVIRCSLSIKICVTIASRCSDANILTDCRRTWSSAGEAYCVGVPLAAFVRKPAPPRPGSPEDWPGDGSITRGVPKKARHCD